MSTLGELGEREIIRRLAPLLPHRSDVVLGLGDDSAVVDVRGAGDHLLLTSDPLVEGVHFETGTPPEQIGHKALGRTYSDVAACGGEPLWSLVNLAAPPETQWQQVEGVYHGMAALATRHGGAIVGGDVCASPVFQLHVFTTARVPRGAAVTRAGAKPGDGLYVTGSLGGSRSGKHLTFEPRLTEGAWLREGRWAHAMVDVTDGLASELRHLLAAGGVGAEVESSALPVTEGASVEQALADGEDFELLFSVAAEREEAFRTAWAKRFSLPCTRVGRVTEETGVLQLDGQAHEGGGFEHFQAP